LLRLTDVGSSFLSILHWSLLLPPLMMLVPVQLPVAAL
jgi:hypothetical protein